MQATVFDVNSKILLFFPSVLGHSIGTVNSKMLKLEEPLGHCFIFSWYTRIPL